MFVHVKALSLPEAWEKSIIEVWKKGIIIDTEYGEKSKDIPIAIEIENPFAEPRVHLKGIVAGKLKGLFEYVDEVVKGIHDDKVKEYGYTYHDRLFNYTIGVNLIDIPAKGSKVQFKARTNQIDYIIRKLKEAPYSRRAQAITWKPWIDPNSEYPPCLQRIWCRVINRKLVMHVHMRSNDALKASFMNMFAFTELQKYIAEKVGADVGYYIHIVDSFHIYESDWKWAEKFVEQIESGKSTRYWMETTYFKKISAGSC